VNSSTCCPVLELRQYTLRPGGRDVLIELFEREFIESQEALGVTLVGQFRDMDNPDRFVWLRGFADMATRAQALQDFYGGPVWKAHREAANETMIDSDNVLLLRPAQPTSGFSLENAERQAPGVREQPKSLIVANICHLGGTARDDLGGFFQRVVRSELVKAGASILSCFVTENHPNTFPALPVREDANVFIWFARFPDQAAYEAHTTALGRSSRWTNEIAPEMRGWLQEPPEILKLQPTRRSRLHG
jgi:quinol monooxygenase YgiN